STLLSLLAGLDRPSSGDLVVATHDLVRISEKRLTHFRRKAIGMVFQSFNLLPTLTVFENACLPALLAGLSLPEITPRAEQLLGWLHLDHRLTHLPAQLSGGEMQRTAIARALINDPAIILADEPTGNLDSRNGEVVMALLSELNRTGHRTVVVATHSSLADPHATRQINLRDGRIADQT
ncbi:MAG: ABC transporter ATP-binding protein, partial [Desulfobacterales bacterium]